MDGREIGRRRFIASAAAAAFAAAGRLGAQTAGGGILVASAKADNELAGAVRSAVESLGGIGRFIKGGERVMLLPNPQGLRTGASTRPDLVAEVVSVCLKAGASEVRVCSIHYGSRWSGTGIDKAALRAGAAVWTPSGSGAWREAAVAGAARQKTLRVISPALDSDVFINLPIAKHHGSTRFTGTLKNLMGINAGNAGWHQGTSYLVDSIVDLAATVKPQLHIVDVTEVLAENGPFGPGRNVVPGRIVAGVDPVAVDTVCLRLVGMNPGEVSTVVRAHERGLGTMRLTEVSSTAELTTWRGT